MSQPQRPTGGAITAMHIHLIGGSVCMALMACAWFSGVGPAVTARAEAASHRSAIAHQEREEADLRDQVVRMERQISRAVYEERQSPLRLEPVAWINQRLSEVSNLAAQVGLDVSVIRPEQVQSRSRFEMVPIRLQGTGTFRESALFLHQLHQTFPDMGVAAVDVKGRLNDVQGGADFAFTLVWYAAPGKALETTDQMPSRTEAQR